MSRLIFQVVKLDGAWAVEHQGAHSNRSVEKAVAVAAANRLARTAISGGAAVQVRIEGESGYF
ncbi:MAG: DUF2188 domain-containing protein [Alphaproteobacteria bacterium]